MRIIWDWLRLSRYAPIGEAAKSNEAAGCHAFKAGLGDRKVYVDRIEVKRLLEPQKVRR